MGFVHADIVSRMDPRPFVHCTPSRGMESLEAQLDRARDLDVEELADAVEAAGFECTRCGGCCTADGDEPHTATVFPDEIRRLIDGNTTGLEEDHDWEDVARPMPYGLERTEEGQVTGETFEWALQTDENGDCVFYEERDGVGRCTVHDRRPLICRTYPFSVDLGGSSQSMGEAVDREGVVRVHACSGTGRPMPREHAVEFARTLKRRAIRELEEAIAVRDTYEPAPPSSGTVVVHDSEGAKRRDGTLLGSEEKNDSERSDTPDEGTG